MTIKSRFSRGCGRFAGALLMLAANLPASAALPEKESLAFAVPSNIGLFVEVRDGEDLLLALSQPDLWRSLADLAGQPAELADTGEWTARIEKTIAMSPPAAIRKLFSKRVAFVGEGPGRSQDAAVLCRPAEPLPRLIELWKARPQPFSGKSRLYHLYANLGLATSRETLCFGDPRPTEGTFQQILTCFERDGVGSLAADSEFLACLAEVPPSPHAVLFARFHPQHGLLAGPQPTASSAPSASQPNSAPASAPASLAASRMWGDRATLLLAMHRDADRLAFTIVGDEREIDSRERGAGVLAAAIPPEALLAISGRLDMADATRELQRLPAARAAIRLLDRAAGFRDLLDSLDGRFAIAVGEVPPPSTRETAPLIPAIGISLGLKRSIDDDQAATWLSGFVSAYNLVALSAGRSPLQAADVPRDDERRVSVLPLDELLPPGLVQEHLAELEFAYAIDKDRLIIATHRAWLGRFLGDAPKGASEASGAVEVAAADLRAPGARTFFDTETGTGAARDGLRARADVAKISRDAARWIDYLRTIAPECLDENWWRSRQPVVGVPRLGFLVTPDAETRRLRVDRVEPDSPAFGVLQPGDQIVSVERREFATSQPAREFREAIEQRPHATWVDIVVQRDRDVRLPRRLRIPFANPVDWLSRLAALGQLTRSIEYAEDRSSPRRRGTLVVELNEGALRSQAVPPASKPASPVGQ